MLLELFINSLGFPISTILPSSMTMTLSQDLTVFILCAIVITVELLNIVSTALVIISSVIWSTEEVASSNIIILLFRYHSWTYSQNQRDVGRYR